MPKYYIAYSIHGTNVFIVATKETNDPLPKGFEEVESRRPAYDRKQGIKVHWTGLLSKKRTPLRSPPHILQRFKKLETTGWTIDKRAFLSKHYPRVKPQ